MSFAEPWISIFRKYAAKLYTKTMDLKSTLISSYAVQDTAADESEQIQ